VSTKDRSNMISTWTEVGRTWSKFGRAIGKVALENVAEALKKTAQALDTPEDDTKDGRSESAAKTPKDNG
jgi:hypothetical protein